MLALIIKIFIHANTLSHL